ncbi:MAG: TRAM domain-containing protein [Spirochaetaceae bacterium]|nr:TRAM domain-containing protein [Spirochaetaceae bacterium]
MIDRGIITIEKIIALGDGMGHLEDGRVVFVPRSLPGERVKIRVTRGKKDFLRGEITEIMEASPHRIPPRCGYCGGCDLQIALSDCQTKIKLDILQDTFRRAGCAIPPVETITGSPWEYRSRFQFHRRTVPPDCPAAVGAIRRMLQKHAFSSIKLARWNLFAGTGGVAAEGLGDPVCEARLLDKTFRFDVGGFFQSNLPLAERMIPEVCRGLSGGEALDMYSGAGVFAGFLLDAFDRVTTVEQNPTSVAWAVQNLREMSVLSRCTAFAQSARDWVKQNAAARFDAVVADPPRTGLEPETARWLCGAKIPRIRYVSCNPVTLARDAAILCGAGYRLSALRFFDFYPQTHHLELLANFDRRED